MITDVLIGLTVGFVLFIGSLFTESGRKFWTDLFFFGIASIIVAIIALVFLAGGKSNRQTPIHEARRYRY